MEEEPEGVDEDGHLLLVGSSEALELGDVLLHRGPYFLLGQVPVPVELLKIGVPELGHVPLNELSS